jgi:hypothetical protein
LNALVVSLGDNLLFQVIRHRYERGYKTGPRFAIREARLRLVGGMKIQGCSSS